MIWSRCPKISGRDHSDAPLAAAVVAFNDGSSGLARALSHVGINPGSHMLSGLSARDRKRKRESNINASMVAKKIRQSRRKKKKSIEDSMFDKEGVFMSQGLFKDNFKHIVCSRFFSPMFKAVFSMNDKSYALAIL